MPMHTSSTARLHVIPARESSLALVLRRGPTRQVCTLLWDRHNDKFKIGQWLKARIAVDKCDLSPDGRYFIYFAVTGKWDSEAKGSYTAVSRAPWLKALALYPLGDCWAGGGLFTSNRTYWLNDRGWAQHTLLRESAEVERDFEFMKWTRGPEQAYALRLEREGWIWKAAAKIYEKLLPAGWTLRKYVRTQREKHELVQPETGRVLPYPDWEWADLDRKTLVWAAAGCLYRARLKQAGPAPAKLLYDFNPMKFEPRIAPY